MDQLPLLRERMARLHHLAKEGAPDCIMEQSAALVVRHLAMLWPGLWVEFGRDLQEDTRNRAALCCDCGETEIPAVLSHPITCRACAERQRAAMKADGLDPYSPAAPKTEEMMVELMVAGCKKVNNLDPDFVDDMERMVEARTDRIE